MGETIQPRKKRRWLRIAAIVMSSFLVLVVALYFVATSQSFLKGVVLPRVGKSLNADVTASDISLHPFSGIALRQVKIQSPGFEPIFQADALLAHYHLGAILRGNIQVDEITVESPVIKIVEAADGRSNLDALQKKEPAVASTKPSSNPSPPGHPPQIAIKNVSMKNATIRKEKKNADGTESVTEISHLNLDVDRLENGQSGKLNITSEIDSNSGTGSNENSYHGNLDGKFDFTLTANLLPSVLHANARINTTKATGTLQDLARLSTVFEGEITPSEIKSIELRFEQPGKPLGRIHAHGPFDASKKEGRITLEITSIDRQVLNLIGASKGIDFGQTRFQSTNEIVLSEGGSAIAVSGQLSGTAVSLTQTNQSTPPLDILARYHVSTQPAQKTALVQALEIDALQNQKPLLKGTLSKPMKINLGSSSGAAEESSFNLSLTNFNLTEWRMFIGDSISSGTVSGSVNLLSQDGGDKLTFDIVTRLASLVLKSSEPSQPNSPINLDLRGNGSWQKQILDLRDLQVTFSPTARAKNEAHVKGQIDLANTNSRTAKLVVQSDSLDLTSFWVSNDSAAKPDKKSASKSAPTSPAPPTSAEPKPISLPLAQMNLQLDIGKLFLREIEIANLQAAGKLNHSKLDLNPLQCSINGAPVKGAIALDLGQPGFAYNISFSADKIPLEPLANSVMPDKRGQYQGLIVANAQIKGAGTTGTSLKTNLSGVINFNFTNANIKIVGPKLRPFLTTIAFALQTPELTSSPLQWMAADVSIGSGIIDLKKFQMLSDAFTADTAGQIPIADILTNSPLRHLPMNFALSRNLAARTHLISDSAHPDAAYVALPDLVKVDGTLGDPKPTIDKKALVGAALEKYGAKIPGLNGQSGQLIQGLGGLIGGKSAQTNSATQTNTAPGSQTNSAPVVNQLLDLLKKKK